MKADHLQPDVVMKDYWRSNERFADLINAVCFGGEVVVKAEDLIDADTDVSHITDIIEGEGGSVGEQGISTVHANRDNSKYQIWRQEVNTHEKVSGEAKEGRGKAEKDTEGAEDTAANVIEIRKNDGKDGISLVLWAVDTQTHVHYAMPLRMMGYDYGDYKKQYEQVSSKYTTEWMEEHHISGNEYLSRMKPTDKFSPVITICVYMGEEPWDGSRTLKEMLKIPDRLSKWVNDYPLHLVDVRRDVGLVFHNESNQDLFQILRIISDRTLPHKKVRENLKNYKGGRGVDGSVANAVYSLTKRKVLMSRYKNGEEVSMDRFVQELLDEERKEWEEREAKERKDREVKERKDREEREERDRRIAKRLHDMGDDIADIAEMLGRSSKQVEEMLMANA